MEQEFSRDQTWKDWKGCRYTLRGEWAYVTGRATALPGCTPGTRDANNDGKSPEDFVREGNEMIEKRRAEGIGLNLPRSHAVLTRDEVLAVRLYSGPAYQPINGFLRQVSGVGGVYRQHLAEHPQLTFTATVRNLCCAIRKLAAHTPPEEATKWLYRGVRGEIESSFWETTDQFGMACAVDMAFMSTSKNRSTPVAYMKPGKNVLWRLHADLDSDSGFHRGADISMFSQFVGEEEVLFPPMTMLQVLRTVDGTRFSHNNIDESSLSANKVEENSPSANSSAGGRPAPLRRQASTNATSRFQSQEQLEEFKESAVKKEGKKEMLLIDVLPSFM